MVSMAAQSLATSHVPLLIAVAIGVAAIALLLVRRQRLPRATVACLVVAIALLTAAAGDVQLSLPRHGEIVVMVDLSPSTRTAIYRDRRSLDDRLSQLLGSRPFRVIGFAERNGELPAGESLADWPATHTVFDPPAGATDAIVLLSDGRFDAPKHAPPTFCVIDGGLIDPPDTAIVDGRLIGLTSLSFPLGESTETPGLADLAEVTVRHSGPDRWLSLDGGAAQRISGAGDLLRRFPVAAAVPPTHRATLSTGDAWPENDVLTFADADARPLTRWWVGTSPAPADWLAVAPSAMPTDAAEFLSPGVIALDNVAANDLSPAALQRLQQYVRDLGGSLLITGGDHAFALGGYSGGALDELSPLASDPPTPATHWLLVTDASGSMAGEISGSSGATDGGANAAGAGTRSGITLAGRTDATGATASPRLAGGGAPTGADASTAAGSAGGAIAGGGLPVADGGAANRAVASGAPSGAVAPGSAAGSRVAADSAARGAATAGAAASNVGGSTRWAAACGALSAIVRELPPADTVSVGSFAADVRWWIDGVAVRDAAKQPIPPVKAAPGGPTNLQAALEKLAGTAGGDSPKDLLILTDGEASLEHADAIATAMASHHLRLHVLAIGNGQATEALRAIAKATGGSFATELNAAKWLAGARSLVRGAMPDRRIAGPVLMESDSGQPRRAVSPANRTWLRATASRLARAEVAGETIPLAAEQQVGAGRVVALAFSPNAAEVAEYAARFAQPPRDPRYLVDFSGAIHGRLTVEAREGGRNINGLSLTAELSTLEGSPASVPFEQTGPGLYAAAIPDSTQPRLAKVLLAGHELVRQPIAGRYAHEFDAVGIDRPALEALAASTGGRVIEPAVKTPIDLPRTWRTVSLTPWLAIAAACLIGVGLVHWKQAGGVR